MSNTTNIKQQAIIFVFLSTLIPLSTTSTSRHDGVRPTMMSIVSSPNHWLCWWWWWWWLQALGGATALSPAWKKSRNRTKCQ